MIEVKVNRIHKLVEPIENMRAFADIEVNGEILIKGLRILNGKHGLFVSMPRLKGRDNKWYETVRPMTPQMKQQIMSVVLGAYDDGKE